MSRVFLEIKDKRDEMQTGRLSENPVHVDLSSLDYCQAIAGNSVRKVTTARENNRL